LYSDAVISAAHILDVPYAAIFEFSPDGDKLILQGGLGWPAHLIGQASVELKPDNPIGYAYHTGEPVVLADQESENRFKQPTLLRGYHLVGGLNLAVRGQAQAYGVLGVYTTNHRRFTEDDLHFLQAIANILAATIERSRSEAQIRAAMEEKEILLREIHHRVKNNLQIILSLLSLQSGYLGEIKPHKVIQDIEGRVRSMALVHEKLYRSDNLAQIDLREYVVELVNHLFRMHRALAREISFNLEADYLFLSMDTAVQCGLIINELVTNALTHAFPDGYHGEVRIEFALNGAGWVNLSVADNGIGMPPESELQESASLGLQVVDNLAQQLEGTIERLPAQGKLGTLFKISFPYDQEA
jgi:two-component sensor histidine kinase